MALRDHIQPEAYGKLDMIGQLMKRNIHVVYKMTSNNI